jgi:hypothetical protein
MNSIPLRRSHSIPAAAISFAEIFLLRTGSAPRAESSCQRSAAGHASAQKTRLQKRSTAHLIWCLGCREGGDSSASQRWRRTRPVGLSRWCTQAPPGKELRPQPGITCSILASPVSAVNQFAIRSVTPAPLPSRKPAILRILNWLRPFTARVLRVLFRSEIQRQSEIAAIREEFATHG